METFEKEKNQYKREYSKNSRVKNGLRQRKMLNDRNHLKEH